MAGDHSAARLARVIIGHVGGDVYTVAVARELVVHSLLIIMVGDNSNILCISFWWTEAKRQDGKSRLFFL